MQTLIITKKTRSQRASEYIATQKLFCSVEFFRSHDQTGNNPSISTFQNCLLVYSLEQNFLVNICIYDGFVLTDLIDCYNVLTTLSFANPESYFGFLRR